MSLLGRLTFSRTHAAPAVSLPSPLPCASALSSSSPGDSATATTAIPPPAKRHQATVRAAKFVIKPPHRPAEARASPSTVMEGTARADGEERRAASSRMSGMHRRMLELVRENGKEGLDGCGKAQGGEEQGEEGGGDGNLEVGL